MTTIQTGSGVTVPEVLTEEHHEAIRASWELPAYEREALPPVRSTKPLAMGVLGCAVGLAIGFGAGYWAHSEMVQAPAPFVISRLAGPVDANGMTFGRRLAPLETALPFGITMAGPVDANGAPLGRRVAPFETQAAGEVPVATVYPAGLYGGRPAPIE